MGACDIHRTIRKFTTHTQGLTVFWPFGNAAIYCSNKCSNFSSLPIVRR